MYPVPPARRSRAATFAAVSVGTLATIGIVVMIASLLACAGWLTAKRSTTDSRRAGRIEACRLAAEKAHVKWYYTDREGCIGKGVFGVHVPLDIDSPPFHE